MLLEVNMSDLSSSDLPSVSLALPVYNGEKFIVDAIRSILAQDHKNFELIITDNASTDGTEKICRDFAASDQRVRYVRNERNLGAGPNYNLGFELSRGKYFKWCACDDRISEDFVSASVASLEQNQDAVLAYGTTQTIDQNGRLVPLVGKMLGPQLADDRPMRRFKKFLNDRNTNFEIFGLHRSAALKNTTMHRSYYGSDKTLMAELTLLGRFIFVPGILFYNREHPDRSINIWDKKDLAHWIDTNASGKPYRPNLQRLGQLIEIAVRHRDIVSPARTLAAIFAWALRPAQLGRYTAELVGLVSPSAQLWLLRAARRLLNLTESGSARLLKSQMQNVPSAKPK
jgi:glycosyltransferase involved in cell wall biosynthesis